MQVSFRRLVKFNMLFTVTATNSNVKITNDNFLEHVEFELEYESLSERIVRGRTGESDWTSIGWVLLAMPFFVYLFVMVVFFPDYRRVPIAIAIYSGLWILGLISFAMRLVKEDWIWFYNNDNSVAFAIKIDKRQRKQTEALIEFIQQKISKTKRKKSSRKK